MSVSIEQVTQALSIFNINDDVKTKIVEVLNIVIGSQSSITDEHKASANPTTTNTITSSNTTTSNTNKTSEAKPKKTRYRADKKDKEMIKDILIARKYYWNYMKKDGTSYEDFCSLWDDMNYSAKYSIVGFYENSVKSYKSAKVKPLLNEEDKDYINDPKLDKIIAGRKAMWNMYQFKCYNEYPYEEFAQVWDTMDLDERDEIYQNHESWADDYDSD
jgi:hypothetical protein